jgi:hypothetical protein
MKINKHIEEVADSSKRCPKEGSHVDTLPSSRPASPKSELRIQTIKDYSPMPDQKMTSVKRHMVEEIPHFLDKRHLCPTLN